MKFKKKPLIVEALRLNENYEEVITRFGKENFQVRVQFTDGKGSLLDVNVLTEEGPLLAKPGDWIIKGLKGELYPCKPDIFEMTYVPEAQKKWWSFFSR